MGIAPFSKACNVDGNSLSWIMERLPGQVGPFAEACVSDCDVGFDCVWQTRMADGWTVRQRAR